MTLREEVLNLSEEDTLNEGVAAALVVLGAYAGIALGIAGANALVSKLKAKKWEKAKRVESLTKKAFKTNDKIIFGFDVDKNHFKTYIVPSEGYMMKFNQDITVVGVGSGKTYHYDEYEFWAFEADLKKEITEKYKELLDNLRPEDKDIKKLLEEKLSVELYCRDIVAFSESQKRIIEDTVRQAIEDAGFKKFKLKVYTGTYRK